MKNNKSPDIDGISADFIKVFWHKLKFFITNAINRCYAKGILTVLMSQSIIPCLSKGNKDCKLIKNWRPISLLTVVHKMASAVIAERLKPILKSIISTHKLGFISGRSISESTQLIYDLRFYTRKNKKPGPLMQIKFWKAFDSVSWDFLYTVLQRFGFDDNFIKWIKLFNNEIKAFVTQCGFFVKPCTNRKGM